MLSDKVKGGNRKCIVFKHSEEKPCIDWRCLLRKPSTITSGIWSFLLWSFFSLSFKNPFIPVLSFYNNVYNSSFNHSRLYNWSSQIINLTQNSSVSIMEYYFYYLWFSYFPKSQFCSLIFSGKELCLCNCISWIISRAEHRTVGLQPTLSPDGRAREALTLSIDLQHLFSEGFALLYISSVLRNVCLTLFPCKCTFNVFLLSSPYKTIFKTKLHFKTTTKVGNKIQSRLFGCFSRCVYLKDATMQEWGHYHKNVCPKNI